MGKMINSQERNRLEIENLRKKIEAFIKKKSHTQISDLSQHPDGTYWLQVDGPEGLASDLADIINKSDLATVLDYEDHPGTYDWAADVYNKDCSTVHFKL